MNKKSHAFYFLGFCLIINPFFLLGEETYVSPQDIFQKANSAYEKGDLGLALESYDALVRQGFESSSLYYNLGNVHYRRGERGKAILWFERASRMAPRDSDIQFNLSLARSHIREDENNFIRKIFLTFTNNELSWIVLVVSWLFFLVLGGVILGWIKSETWPTTYLWFCGMILLVSIGWLSANTYILRDPIGIVVAPPGEVRNGPGLEYAVGFTIPEGSKVYIMNKRPDWIQVGVPQQGLKGWMPAKEVEAVSLTSALLS